MTPTLRKVNFNDELLLSLSYDEDTGKASVTIEVLKDSEPIVLLVKQEYNTRMEAWQCYNVKHEQIEALYT
jgi:hypothetical protein|nr:MAG TPA: hypothetical protein [Caudoviricetes sp.]